ncbi:hypothetical protein JCM9279_002775 [Rhodotorula babjevae]
MLPKSLAAAVAAASLFGSSFAAPLVAPAKSAVQLVERASGSDFNVTYSSKYTEHLPRTLIIATGGTIAGSSDSNTDTTTYTAGTVGIEQLIVAVPELLNVSNVDGIQFSNIASESISDGMALNLSRLVNRALCSNKSEWDAVVITHGTDTLEETAFFIDATLQCDKPVVVSGAMRPSTAIGADGGNNLLSAVTTAVTPSSRNRGTLIVLNDRICQAWYCQKTQANTVDTFASPEQGYVGTLLSTKPLYYSTAAQPTFKRVYDLSNVTSLPPVEVLIGYQGADLSLMDTAVNAGAKGIIIAGVGSGSVSETGKAHVAKAVEKGVPVVRSTKINVGFSVPAPAYANTIAAGSLNPVKARRLLQILLALGKSDDEVKQAFEGELQGFLTLDLKKYY